MKITYTGRQVELKPSAVEEARGPVRQNRQASGSASGNARSTSFSRWSVTCTKPRPPSTTTITSWSGSGRAPICSPRSIGASEKLEKQCVKARTKWRDTKRAPRKTAPGGGNREAAAALEPEPEAEPENRVYRVNHHQKRKPMTLEEAMLEMDRRRDYLVYRDAETDRVNGAGSPPRRPLRPGRGIASNPCRRRRSLRPHNATKRRRSTSRNWWSSPA